MKQKEIVTSNLADFKSRERSMLCDLLLAWEKQGLPDDFNDDGVTAMFNRNSGCVFLTNEDYDTLMMNGDKLERWYTCFNCGHEGFHEDCRTNDDGCNECNPIEGEE